MKHNFILFLIIFSFQTFAQGFYTKIINPSNQLTSAGTELFKHQDDIIFFNRGFCPLNEDSLYECASLVRCDQSGNELQRKLLKVKIGQGKGMAIGDSLIALVNDFYGNDGEDFRYTDSFLLSIFDIHTLEIKKQLLLLNPLLPTKNNRVLFDIIKYKDKYVISVMAGFGTNYFQNGKQKLFPHLIWVNEDMTLDTIIKIDLPYGEIYQMAVDQNGNLKAMVTQRTIEVIPNGNENIEEYKGYLVYNDQKKLIKSKLVKVDKFENLNLLEPNNIHSMFCPDGKKVFVAERFDINNTEIHCWDKDDNLLWVNKQFWRNEYAHSPSDIILCKNGDIIQAGSASIIGMRTCGYIHRISSDGKTKWIRYYGYNFEGFQNKSLGNWIRDIQENEDGSLLALGTIVNGYVDHATHNVKNDSTWIFRVDSMGCMEGNKCNDEYVWNGPDDWFQFDRLTLKHKEWNYQKTNSEGTIVNIQQRFGQDTTMYDKNLLTLLNTGSGWARYKPVITKDVNTGEETQDSLFVSWMKEGRVFGLTSKNCLQCRNHVMLYDFTMSLHDTFILPYGYGKAIVTQVDSIALIPGYLRKRIVLQHLNLTNQAKYGDLVWIEGIGSPNGILYYKDWQEGTKTELTCYYDRGEKRYSSTNDPDCRKEVVSNFLSVLSPNHIWYAVESSGWSPKTHYQRFNVDPIPIVIDDKSYQQILTSSDSTGTHWEKSKKYVREDDGKMWVIDSTVHAVEVCIMDMNLNKGDEFSYKVGFSGNTLNLLVSKVDSIMDFKGQIRKVIHLSCDLDPNIRYRWIEGIGPDVGVFSTTFLHCVIDGNENSLTCFYKDEAQHWQNEVFNHCWKPSPPVVEAMIPILNSNIVRYVLINSLFYPHYKMERWKFNFLATVKENAKAYYELLVSEKENGNDFIGSGRFFREEDNRFYQYISPSEGERLLYDMNLKAGDSIMMDYADGPVTLVVTKEDSIQLDDEKYLKRLTLQCVINGELGFGNAAEWIEGIGRLYEPLVDFSHCSVASIPSPDVYCIYDQNQRIYKNIEAPSDCWVDDFYTTDMDTTATWYSSSYVDDFSSGDCRLKIDITKVVRDTSIQYRKCRIIGVFTDGKYLPESEIITFQNADKLYFYEDNNWKLLYDFAARVGDTVTYFVSKKYPYYVKYNVPGPFEDRIVEDNPYQIVIQEIDTILDFSGKPLKRFKTDQISNFQGHFMGEIIENVGSKEKLFGNNVIITPPECNPSEEFPRLRCYSDDDIFIKFTEGECEKLTRTTEILDFAVKLYPNPGNDWLNINLGSGVVFPISYQMTDIAGRIIGTDIQNTENFSIKSSHLKSGLYIISVRDKAGKVWHGKWVKK